MNMLTPQILHSSILVSSPIFANGEQISSEVNRAYVIAMQGQNVGHGTMLVHCTIGSDEDNLHISLMNHTT